MKKEKLDEHDMTKNMLNIIRNFEKVMINELQNVPSLGSTKQAPNNLQAGDDLPEPEEKDVDSLSPKSGDAVFNDELKKLQDTVDSSVNITNFKIYPTDKNVIIEGTFLKRGSDDSGINFKMSLNAQEVETSMDNIDLNDKVNELLKRLKGYYDNWSEEWDRKLTNEYKPKHD